MSEPVTPFTEVTMPIEPPQWYKIKAKKFRLVHKQQVTPVGAGFIQTINRAEPRWVLEFETAPIDEQSIPYAAYKSWLDMLEGSLNTFLAYDPRRPKPLWFMKKGGEPPPTNILALDYANARIQLSGGDDSKLTVKDYISYKQGNIWRLYQCIGDIQPDGWVYVMPRPISHNGLPIPARLVKPVGEFKMLGDYEEEDSVGSFPVFRWSGYQFINRI